MRPLTIELVSPATSQPVAVLVRDHAASTTRLLLDTRFTSGQRIAAALRLLSAEEIQSLACQHVATACSHAIGSRPFTTVQIGAVRAAGRPPVAVREPA